MGSNSRGKYGEGTSGVKRFEDDDNYEYDDEQEMKFLPASELLLLHHSNGFADPLVQLPSLQHGLTAYHEPPPPLVMPQVPAVATAATMQRPGGVVAQQPQQQQTGAAAFMQQNGGGYVECVVHQRLKSVKIRWNHGGTNVAIAGSWDNWETTLVGKINNSIGQDSNSKSLIRLLDIYGFESFKSNSFEQFCNNFEQLCSFGSLLYVRDEDDSKLLIQKASEMKMISKLLTQRLQANEGFDVCVCRCLVP